MKKYDFNQGYRAGYLDGYENGIKDEKESRDRAYKNNPALDLIIENLELSTRAFQCLRQLGCNRIGDVVDKDAHAIIRTRNMGNKSMDEIARALHKRNIVGTAWDQFLLPE